MPEASTMATEPSSGIRTCTVQLLDDLAIQVEFKKHYLGSVIMDRVCDHLSLAERDYFGLRFMDQNLHRYWLDPSKPVFKQVKTSDSIVFAFRVKFYPADPIILKEEFTRYLLVLQLRRDLLHGRLHCPQNDLAMLAAFILQGEVGDYDPAVHTGNYVSQFKILINQSPKLEEKIIQAHKTLNRGESSADVDINFLKKASSLDTYGYYPYTIKDSKAGQVYMGTTPRGILVYQTSRKLHEVHWDDIEGLDYSGKEFYVYQKRAYFDRNLAEVQDASANAEVDVTNNGSHIVDKDRSSGRPASIASSFDLSFIKHAKKKPHLKFICPNSSYSKQMWKYMLAQKAFFTSAKSDQVRPVVKRHFLFRNATFRWNPSNKVLEELRSVQSPPRLRCPAFERLKIPRQANRDERNGPWAHKFHTLPSRVKNHESVESNGLLPAPHSKSSVEAPDSHAIRPTILRYEDTILPPLMSTNLAINATFNDRLSPIVTCVDSVISSSTATTPISTTLFSSTPKRSNDSGAGEEAPSTGVGAKVVQVRTTVPTLSKPSQVRGSKILSAGTKSETSVRRQGSCSRAIFFTLLITVTVAVLITGAMEWRNDCWRHWVDGVPLLYDFRHVVYEPTRRYLGNKAALLF